MTTSSIAKKLIGVNRCTIENIDIEVEAGVEQLVIKAQPYKCDRCRCGICGRKSPKYDKGKGIRRWRALDIGNSIPVYVESDAPRVKCPEHGVVVSQVPWARHGSGFTKNMEDSAVWLSLYMSKKAVSEYLRVKWETVGSIIGRVVKELSAGTDRFDDLVNIGIDETSYKKGHKYLTVVVNHATNTVVWVGVGFGKTVLESFFELLTDKQKANIKAVSGDGAGWIKDTVEANCPNAVFCIDPFHVVSWVTDILDQIRKEIWNDARKKLSEEKKLIKACKADLKDSAKTEQLVKSVKSSKYLLLDAALRRYCGFSSRQSRLILPTLTGDASQIY